MDYTSFRISPPTDSFLPSLCGCNERFSYLVKISQGDMPSLALVVSLLYGMCIDRKASASESKDKRSTPEQFENMIPRLGKALLEGVTRTVSRSSVA